MGYSLIVASMLTVWSCPQALEGTLYTFLPGRRISRKKEVVLFEMVLCSCISRIQSHVFSRWIQSSVCTKL